MEKTGGAFGIHTVIAPPAQGRNVGGSIGHMGNVTFSVVRALALLLLCMLFQPPDDTGSFNRVLAHRGSW